MANITVTTNQQVIEVTETGGVDVTNTTNEITVLTAGTLIIENAAGTITSVNGQTGPIVVLDTDDIAEGTNKYFSQALARGSLSAGTGINYNTGTGVITNTSINTDTTYTIDAATTSGGANLNLVGSDATTDSVKFASGTNVTVSRTDANTINIASTDTNTTYTIASASTTGGANLNLVGSDSSTDSVAYKGAGATTVTSTDANTVTITSTDTNTTYTQNASAVSGGANLNLVGSDSTTDSIKLASGTNVTVTRTDADTVTISSTDTNTTYTQNASSTTGGANLNLVGSDSTTDSVKFASGTGITVSRTDADTITITNNVVGDVVGPSSATDNALARFDTTTGKLIQNSTAILTDTGDLTLAGDLTVTGQEITTGAASSINITRTTALTSSTLSPLTLRLTTTGTPAVGIGTSLAFETETAVGVNTTAGTIQLQSTSVTPGSESFNMNFLVHSAGASQERMVLDNLGNLQFDGDLTVSGNDIKSSSATALTLSGANVTVVGTLEVDGNQIKASDGTTALTLSASTGNVTVAGTLDVQGGTVTDSTGALQITTASNSNLTLAPNGTGDIVLTLANGGNLTNSRNYVFGAIRNATTESNGDIWVLDADSGGAGTLPVRGVSIDNSADTAKNAGAVVRNYSNTAAFSPRMVFERSRGTAASPVTLSSGDTIGVVSGTGYSSTLGWINDTLPFAPAVSSFTTSEAWVNNTNLGTQFNLLLAPSATTMTTAANLVSVIAANPQAFNCRSDSYTWSNGKTGTTQRMALDVSGNLTVSNSIAATAGTISTTAGAINANGVFDVNQAFSATADLLNTNTVAGSSVSIATKYWTSSAKTTLSVPQNTWKLGNFRFNSYSDTAGTFALGPEILAQANENWTSTANGASIVFAANRQGQSWTTGHTIVISASPESSMIMSDVITLESSSGNDYLVLNGSTATLTNTAGNPLTGNNISYGRVYGQFEYNTTVTPAAINTAYVFPLGSAITNNIATVGSTSRLIPGAAGVYNIQFSAQVKNDNSQEHTAYIFLRKNGTAVTNSTGRVTILRQSSQIVSWNYLITSANTTDYYEIGYAVDDTQITFPAFAATAFAPSAASIITTITPVGA